ncbi:MAG: hypothetical protein J6J11_01845 [Treponema sp.]|nr:hypothetical protein [Clostridia bacterium]MBP3607047.1 hypothetical protein [Treponema sp.]
MEIRGIKSTTVAQNKCASRLISLREEIENNCKEIISSATVDANTKKLVADITSQLILYIQESSSTVYNYCTDTNDDK